MFDDLDDYDDDFEDSMASNNKGEKDFNANELLNFSEYQNKRKENTMGTTDKNLNIKDILNGNAAQRINNEYDGGLEVEDEWGDEWDSDGENKNDLSNFDYKKANLNKLGDRELALHKKEMDKGFEAN